MKTTLTILICFALCASITRATEKSSGWATYYTVKSCQREGTSGTLTASGKHYDESAMTCALPFHPEKVNGKRQWGQKYLIINLQTKKQIIVSHTDYGPGKKARNRGVIMDLTRSAFVALGGKLKDGRIKVRIEKL